MEKKKISAKIIADSRNEHGDRITSYILTFPRHILAELNTHRMFSRNSASSRAIPFKKMVKMCKEDPFIPIAWQKDHSGMQGTEYWTEDDDVNVMKNDEVIGYETMPKTLTDVWLSARDGQVNRATELHDVNVSKQTVNRLLEPFMWHTAIVTATEFENFFKQRCPQYKSTFSDGKHRSWKDVIKEVDDLNVARSLAEDMGQDVVQRLKCNSGQGEIHIMELAEQMWDAMNESTPKELKAGEWHIPFGDRFTLPDKFKKWEGKFSDFAKESQEYLVKVATARCARVSYLNYEGKDDYEADIKLHDRLWPMRHYSPFEHCAQAMSELDYNRSVCANPLSNKIPYMTDETALGWSGNFKGFIQYRKTFEGEDGRK